MSKNKKREFHIPFIKNLVLICVVTIVSMVSAHYFIHNYFNSPSKTPDYTSYKSYNSPE